MDIKENLEIILVTYNRKMYLERTLNQILAVNSPIKDLDIIILDNKSDDGTYELVEEYRKNFHNIKHIVNKKNIGGNCNVARAFEISSKKYLWILCDDDNYDFSNFDVIEKKLLNDDYDAIFTVKCQNDLADIFYQAAFVPACIYKTKNITNTVLANIYGNIPNLFPQLAMISKVINMNGKIYTLKEDESQIIIRGQDNDAGKCYLRGLPHNELASDRKYIYWYVGYINSIRTLINDAKKRTYIIDKTAHCCDNSFKLMVYKLWKNMFCYGFYKKNFIDIFIGLNFRQKIFMFYPALVLAFIKYLFCSKEPIPSSVSEWIFWFNKHKTNKKLNGLFKKYKGKKILLYGKGMITEALLKDIPDFYSNIYAISDLKISEYKDSCNNTPIEIPPVEIKNHTEIDVIFISVYRHKLIEKNLKEMGSNFKMEKII